MQTVEIFANFLLSDMTGSFWFIITHKKAAHLKYKFAPALESPFLQAAMAPSSGKGYLETSLGTRGAHCC